MILIPNVHKCLNQKGKVDIMDYNFYHAYYKEQRYDEKTNQWKDTCFNRQEIIVIADNIVNAKTKINECLKRIPEPAGYRAVLLTNIAECIGLDKKYEYDFFEINPISK